MTCSVSQSTTLLFYRDLCIPHFIYNFYCSRLFLCSEKSQRIFLLFNKVVFLKMLHITFLQKFCNKLFYWVTSAAAADWNRLEPSGAGWNRLEPGLFWLGVEKTKMSLEWKVVFWEVICFISSQKFCKMIIYWVASAAAANWNRLELAGTGWNRLEPGWNRLEPAGTGWNRLEPAGAGLFLVRSRENKHVS